MTDPEITQADADQAASFLESWEPGPEMTVTKLARAFAAHRIAAERETVERIVAYLRHHFGDRLSTTPSNKETGAMTDTEAQPVAIAAPPELAERALMIEMATQMALAAGYAPHCWPTWEQEATVIIPTLARLQRERDQAVEALREITNPIAAMQQRAEDLGAKLDGAVAFQLANDVGYLQGIARATLAAIGAEDGIL